MGSKWVIGEGRRINIWANWWAGNGSIGNIVQWPLGQKESKFIVADLLGHEGEWDLHKLSLELPKLIINIIRSVLRPLVSRIEGRRV